MRARVKKNGYKNGTQYGSLASQIRFGMLPTPLLPNNGGTNGKKKWKEAIAMIYGYSDTRIPNNLLPTPQCMDAGEARPLRLKKDMERDPNKPGSWRGDLKDHIAMIPTPSTRDWKGASVTKARDTLDSLVETGATKGETGKKTGLRLQPGFALWMMGYPEDWCDLADGEMPPSKAQAMRGSRKSQ